MSDKLSFGASARMRYDQTRLIAPYIFQNQPELKGIKATTDLETEGFAFNGDVGLIYKAT